MTATATTDADALSVDTFEAPGLGDRSYLLSDGESAVVVDPQRDPVPYLQRAERLGVVIRAVVETHIHNDYVTGGPALARACGATYAVPAGEPVSFEGGCRELADNDVLEAGRLEMTAIATTGHTDHHLAYLVRLADGAGGSGQVVCTGGSLLVGSTGRTDLLGPELAETLAHAQWHSARRLLTTLAADTKLLATHGFGSFCSASSPGPEEGALNPTIGGERGQNPAAVMEEDEFVRAVLSNLPPIPAYYRFMAPLNRQGPPAPLLEPVELLEVRDLLGSGGEDRWVVDLRERHRYAVEHLRGTLNLELGDNLATYMGWLVPFAGEYLLVAEDLRDVEQARRLLAHIGRETPRGFALWTGTTPLGGAAPASYPVASFAELASALAEKRPLTVLDVRHRYEWEEAHLAAARHIPVTELAARLDEVDPAHPVWVHCAGGYRAAAAASLLSGRGLSPVLVDDSWQQAVETGLRLVAN